MNQKSNQIQMLLTFSIVISKSFLKSGQIMSKINNLPIFHFEFERYFCSIENFPER